MTARYRVHRLLQDLLNPENMARYKSNPDAIFAAYGLDSGESDALRAATPDSLAAIGVHPLLQMILLADANPMMVEMGSIGHLVNQLREVK
jgi:hypothetical protein